MSDDMTPTTASPSATQVRAAAAAFKTAIDAHLVAVENRSGESDPAVQETYDQLREAGLVYDDLLFDAFEEVTPFEAPEVSPEDAVEVSTATGPPERVGLVTRHDFTVIDPEALLDAGREAYRENWPDDGEEATEKQVSHLGAAVYEIASAYGLDGMEERAEDNGLLPEGSTTWVVDTGDVDEHWRDHAFSALMAAPVLYRLDEVYEEDDEDAATYVDDDELH